MMADTEMQSCNLICLTATEENIAFKILKHKK